MRSRSSLVEIDQPRCYEIIFLKTQPKPKQTKIEQTRKEMRTEGR